MHFSLLPRLLYLRNLMFFKIIKINKIMLPLLQNLTDNWRTINLFAPGDFAEKRILKLVKWFSGHCCAIWFTGRTLCGLLIQMQNISLRSSGMRRKQNLEIVFGFKSDTAVFTFTFRFLSSLLFLLFLPHFFFSCWAFSRLQFGGKSF